MTSRKKPGVAFWATVGLVVVVLYAASFAPVASLCDHGKLPAILKQPLIMFYGPIRWAIHDAPGPVRKMVTPILLWCYHGD